MPEPPAAWPRRYAAWMGRDVLTARGPEAESFLQGQLSQDVQRLGENETAWSLVLSPQGKIDALVRVARLPDETWLLDTDAGWGDALLVRLNRFKLRTKVEIESVPWQVLGVRGPDARETSLDGAVLIAAPWPGMDGFDAIGPGISVPPGLELTQGQEQETARILSGMPKMGAELDERTIPAETGIVPLTVSFTKGCYTGQELVARVDSRGSNVPRRLRLLRLSGQVAPGAELSSDGASAGTVTSVARTADGAWIGLGYTKRGVPVPAELTVVSGADAGAEDVRVRVEELVR